MCDKVHPNKVPNLDQLVYLHGTLDVHVVEVLADGRRLVRNSKVHSIIRSKDRLVLFLHTLCVFGSRVLLLGRANDLFFVVLPKTS